MSQLPPNFAYPKFDATLGALYVGSGVATILYGVGCLQMFIYVTAARSQTDRTWLGLFVLLLFGMGTAEQAVMMAGIYRFLVTDFLNPLALPTGGPGSAEVFIYVESLLLACISVMIQLFFCWRIYTFSASSFSMKPRIAFTSVTVRRSEDNFISDLLRRWFTAQVVLALFSFATYIDLAITGFNHRLLTGNTPDFVLAFKLATSSQIAYDVIVTAAMTFILHRARIGIKRTDHVVNIIILFTINTNLLTTILSITGLITFLTLPHATVYGGIGFLLGKTYFNSFLAVLNAREYLSEKFDKSDSPTLVYAEFLAAQRNHVQETEDTATNGGQYELAAIDLRSSNKNLGIANAV